MISVKVKLNKTHKTFRGYCTFIEEKVYQIRLDQTLFESNVTILLRRFLSFFFSIASVHLSFYSSYYCKSRTRVIYKKKKGLGVKTKPLTPYKKNDFK